MNIKLRTATPDDAQRCGTICYEAFAAIANQHNFPPDLPSAEVTIGLLSKLIADPRFYGIVAEIDHEVVGSNFMDERSAIAGIGPITIDPTVQNRGIGRALWRLHGASCRTARSRRSPPSSRLSHPLPLSVHEAGIRHARALGGDAGSTSRSSDFRIRVRKAVEADLQACNRVCFKVHGLDRSAEVLDAIKEGTATVVEHDGDVTAYATVVGFFGHAVGETNEGLKALIGAATVFRRSRLSAADA
jgi:hypothetical protein